jgi:hypothetical protein
MNLIVTMMIITKLRQSVNKKILIKYLNKFNQNHVLKI